MRSWIEISEPRLQSNYKALADVAGAATGVMAVVKANAYGHGASACSVALARAGATWFGVADAREGVAVRSALQAAGFADVRILLLCGPLPEDVPLVREAGLTPVVWTAEQAEWLRGVPGLKVHVELETGMGRQGCRTGAELSRTLHGIRSAGLTLEGLMTHFCAAEVVGSAQTRAQQAAFEAGVQQVRASGTEIKWVHAGTSSSLDNPSWDVEWLRALAASAGASAMVRCGIGLYGYVNPVEGGASRVRSKLLPVMTWKTRVLDVRDAHSGDCLGYNGTYTARSSMRVALLPVGYADGLRRALSSSDKQQGGWVMIHGQRAPIVGRISMNLTLVDVSAVQTVEVADEVLLLGDGVTAMDHARLAGTIPYEILCGVREH